MLRLLALAPLLVLAVHGASVAPEATTVASSTAESAVCEPAVEENQQLFNISSTPEFNDLQEHEQILFFELLAAAEGCDLQSYVNVNTAQRIFLLLENLPLKFSFVLLNFLTTNLQREGVVVPV